MRREETAQIEVEACLDFVNDPVGEIFVYISNAYFCMD